MSTLVLQRQQGEHSRDFDRSTGGSGYDNGMQRGHNVRYKDIETKAGQRRSLSTMPITDIRATNASSLNLRQECLNGLQKAKGEKILPSLLLWDEQGQSLYEDILTNAAYYPFEAERELLEHHADDFARVIADSGVQMLVELGAGSMRKTALVLAALDRLEVPLIYYALDVDYAALEQSLASVKSKVPLRYVTVKGLWGTYDDGAKWLSLSENHRGRRHAVLWLGGSIANLEVSAAGAVLGTFLNRDAPQQLGGIIVGVDSCRDLPALQQAYDIPNGATRRWMWHVLKGARKCLDTETFDFFHQDNWRLDLRWEAERSRFENYLVANRSLKANVGQVKLELEKDEYVSIISSGKWDESHVQEICTSVGLQATHRWQSPKAPYHLYWFRPTSNV